MSNILDGIYSRRSIRNFKTDIPKQSLIQEILKAGAHAPSGGNRQPWRYIVVTDKNIRDLVIKFSPGFHRHTTKPPILLAICSDPSLYGEGQIPRLKAMMDTYLSAENISLAAVALGLGTVMVRSFPEPEIKKILEVPENVDLLLLIALGYPAEEQSRPQPQKKSVEEITYKEIFGKSWCSS